MRGKSPQATPTPASRRGDGTHSTQDATAAPVGCHLSSHNAGQGNMTHCQKRILAEATANIGKNYYILKYRVPIFQKQQQQK